MIFVAVTDHKDWQRKFVCTKQRGKKVLQAKNVPEKDVGPLP